MLLLICFFLTFLIYGQLFIFCFFKDFQYSQMYALGILLSENTEIQVQNDIVKVE